MEKLLKIQTELRAPKNQRNDFGKYNYRSCEDILEALKPLLKEHNCVLNISDDIVEISGRIYVKAKAMLIDVEGASTMSSTAYAREADTKKGMDESQITGAASSYARKYALNGLFLIDDTKDADATNTHDKGETKQPAKAKETTPQPLIIDTPAYLNIVQWVKAGGTDQDRLFLYETVSKKYTITDEVKQAILTAAKAQREQNGTN